MREAQKSCLNSVAELLYELPEDERLHVLGQQGEQLPVPHLAQLADLLHQDGALVDGLGPKVLLQKGGITTSPDAAHCVASARS